MKEKVFRHEGYGSSFGHWRCLVVPVKFIGPASDLPGSMRGGSVNASRQIVCIMRRQRGCLQSVVWRDCWWASIGVPSHPLIHHYVVWPSSVLHWHPPRPVGGWLFFSDDGVASEWNSSLSSFCLGVCDARSLSMWWIVIESVISRWSLSVGALSNREK